MSLTCELNGKKYLAMDLLITAENQKATTAKIKKYGAICQGIKSVSQGGFFSDGHGVVTVLVPEENVIAFDNEEVL